MNQTSIYILLIGFWLMMFSTTQAQTPIAYYPFDNSTADFSGNNNDGLFHGGVKATYDRFGNSCGALYFNGRDGYVEVPSSPSLKSVVKNLSVAVWFKLDSSALHKGNKWLTLICKGKDREEQYYNPQYRVQVYQSKIQSTVSINTDFTEYDTNFVQNSFPYNQWMFFVMVYDGSNVKSYIDGKKIWEVPYAKTFSPNDDPLDIGRDMPGNIEYFCGALDELKIFNSALSETDINALYHESVNAAVSDNINLLCPADMEFSNDPGKCFAKVHFNKALVDNECGSASVRQIGGLRPGAAFPIGKTVVQFEAKSKTGQTKICNTTITVADKEAPLIQCPRDTVIVKKDLDASGIVFNYKLPKVTDNCSQATIKVSEGLESGALFPDGKTVVKFIATDEAGNISECAFSVYIAKSFENNIIETPSCIPDIVQNNDPGKCGAVVKYALPDSRYEVVKGPSSGRFFKVGTTTIKLRKRISSKLTEECSLNIIVKDVEKPQIACLHDTVINAYGKNTSVVYNFEAPEATDNCVVTSMELVSGLASGANFPVGDNIISYLATDAAGNTETCTFHVKVVNSNMPEPKKVVITDNHEKTETKTYLPDKVSYTPDMKFTKCELTILLYDDGQEDHDTVSVYFNGEEIVQQEMIRLKEHHIIMRTVMLQPKSRNDFIVRAWNNGSISPNTIKIEFYEGKYNDNMIRFKKQKPKKVRVLHSRPGQAGAISIQCSGR